jgi:hypothetical protein
VIIGAAEVSGADIGALRVGCNARLGGQRLRVAKTRFVQLSGRGTCTWRIPSGSAGKMLQGTISAASPVSRITRKFSFRVG